MIISEKQIICLIEVLRSSLPINSSDFCINRQERIQLYQTIINQQSKELKEIK